MPEPTVVPPAAPPLTVAMIAADKDTGTSPPGAGGWTPTPGQRVAGTLIAGVLGSLAPVLLTALPHPWGTIAAAVSGALALGLGTLLGLSSAGPRTVQ